MAVFRVTRVRRAGTDVVEVCGDLDASAAPRLAAVVDSCVRAGSTDVEIDLAGATLIDAYAVGLLLRAARALEERGVPLRLTRAGGTVARVLEVGGAGHMLPPEPADGEALRTAAVAENVHQLLRAADALAPDDPRRNWLRERAVEQALPYARRLASRYSHRGEPVEDLCQVAAMGLVKAVNGYRPERATGFLGYATPTILGELRRHFRDAGWTVRVPRRLQELRPVVNRGLETLTQALGRRPGTAELASFLEVPEEDVAECLAASQSYHPISLSTPLGPHDSQELGDSVGADDPALDLVERRQAVAPLLATLTPHEREVVTLRFFGEMTQSQIAARVGASQMHVSRLLASVLSRLHDALTEAEAATALAATALAATAPATAGPAEAPATATRYARQQRATTSRRPHRPRLATRS